MISPESKAEESTASSTSVQELIDSFKDFQKERLSSNKKIKMALRFGEVAVSTRLNNQQPREGQTVVVKGTSVQMKRRKQTVFDLGLITGSVVNDVSRLSADRHEVTVTVPFEAEIVTFSVSFNNSVSATAYRTAVVAAMAAYLAELDSSDSGEDTESDQ